MESIQLQQTTPQVDIRVYIRNTYIRQFNKGRVIDYMAFQDIEIGFRVYGRIEVIEFLAFGIYPETVKFTFRDQEELNYYTWLKGQGWKN